MKLFKSNWGKWIPLGTFKFAYNTYIVLARKNNKTGMLRFKHKKMSSYLGAVNNNNYVPSDLLDVKRQWKILTHGGR